MVHPVFRPVPDLHPAAAPPRVRRRLAAVGRFSRNGTAQDAGIAELDRAEAIHYLEVFSKLFNVPLNIDDYAIGLDKKYRFDIWGNRRNFGMRWLSDHGCSTCQAEVGFAKAANHCARSHSAAGQWLLGCRVYPGIDPIKALSLQLSENSYSPPSREHIAETMQEHWEISRAVDPKLSKKAYAAKCGFSVDYVSDSLRFCELPDAVKKMVRSGLIKWGSALHLNKMVDAGLPDERINRVAQLVIAGNLRVPDVEKRVRFEINSEQDLNQGMFADLDEDPATTHRAEVKRLLDKRALTALRMELSLLQQARRAVEKGLIDSSDIASNPEIQQLLDMGDELRKTLASL